MEDSGSFLSQGTQCFLHAVYSVFIDQWTHQDPRIQGISYGNLPVNVDEFRCQNIVDVLVSYYTPHSGTPLPRCADSSKKDRLHRKLQIGAVAYNNSIVTAEFEKGLTKPADNYLP